MARFTVCPLTLPLPKAERMRNLVVCSIGFSGRVWDTWTCLTLRANSQLTSRATGLECHRGLESKRWMAPDRVIELFDVSGDGIFDLRGYDGQLVRSPDNRDGLRVIHLKGDR